MSRAAATRGAGLVAMIESYAELGRSERAVDEGRLWHATRAEKVLEAALDRQWLAQRRRTAQQRDALWGAPRR